MAANDNGWRELADEMAQIHPLLEGWSLKAMRALLSAAKRPDVDLQELQRPLERLVKRVEVGDFARRLSPASVESLLDELSSLIQDALEDFMNRVRQLFGP